MPEQLRHPGPGRKAEGPSGQVHEDDERSGNDGLECEDGRCHSRDAEGDNRLPAVESGTHGEAEEEARTAEECEELECVRAQDPDRRPAFGRSA
jgi:hypothetical protein